MKVEVSIFAKQEVRKTARYIRKEFGEKSKNKFMVEYYHTLQLLATNPLIGPVEQSLDHFPIEYHSIVVAQKNKAIYHIESKDLVKIDDFWDCRRDPKALADRATEWE